MVTEEYVYHGFLLHSAERFFAQRHLLHHRATGTPEEAAQLTFGESPLWIVPLFVVNGLAALAVDRLSGLGIVVGMLSRPCGLFCGSRRNSLAHSSGRVASGISLASQSVPLGPPRPPGWSLQCVLPAVRLAARDWPCAVIAERTPPLLLC
jgi:hypothetical protein